jgi:hypothetical protein
MLRVAAECGVGSGTVQRIKREMEEGRPLGVSAAASGPARLEWRSKAINRSNDRFASCSLYRASAQCPVIFSTPIGWQFSSPLHPAPVSSAAPSA